MQARFTVPLPSMAPRACVVCAQPQDGRTVLTSRRGAGAGPNEAYPLCREPGCRAIFEQAGPLPDAEFRRQLQRRAGDLQWRAQRRREHDDQTRALRELRKVRAREAAAAFAAIGPRADLGPSPTLHLVVPSGRRPSRPLPERRRQAYLAHLDAILAAARRAPTPRATPPDEPATALPAIQLTTGHELGATNHGLPERLCGACGGGCCPAGGTHAFQKEETIRRVLADRPDLDPARLRQLYVEHLPRRSIPGSCVFHTRLGCNLPRALRGDPCNQWACFVLKSLHRRLEADPPVRKVIVLRRQLSHWEPETAEVKNEIVGAAVLTELATTHLKQPKPEGWMALAAKGGDPSS
jgi:hypothetical protein